MHIPFQWLDYRNQAWNNSMLDDLPSKDDVVRSQRNVGNPNFESDPNPRLKML